MSKLKAWWDKIPQRLKSVPAWLALISAVVVFLGNDTIKQITGMDSDSLITTVKTMLSILVAFGIFNNPTNLENF